MKRDYRFDELVKMIKKNYVDSLSNDVHYYDDNDKEITKEEYEKKGGKK